ncbi:hypothetical protein C8R44DRAFT_866943 [Mycena epipterygia]|nr:hypothetical protein C8R44DRAFT_866943 [Mycena epipterygia]
MATILATSQFASDFVLGVQQSLENHIYHYYVAPDGTPFRALVFGCIHHVMDMASGSRVLVLVAPDEHSPMLRVMFDNQNQVLDSVIVADKSDYSTRIISEEHWSQGPESLANGVVFVRLFPDTVIDIVNVSEDVAVPDVPRSVLSTFARETPCSSIDGDILQQGSLVCCVVELFRADTPAYGSQTVYDRAYTLNAFRAIGVAIYKSRPPFLPPAPSVVSSMTEMPSRREFNDMPNEILDDILSMILDAFLASPWQAFVALREALCLICPLWRDLIYLHTGYWTRFTFHRYSNTDSIAAQLARSKGAPISLTLDLFPDGTPVGYRVETLESVVPTGMHRAGTVINLTQQEYVAQVLPAVKAAFHQVGTLQVIGDPAGGFTQVLEQLATFDSPNLSRATFQLPRTHPNNSAMFHLCGEWHTLRDLALKSILPSQGDSQAIFRNLTALRLFHLPKATNLTWDALAFALGSVKQLVVLQLDEIECTELGSARRISLTSVTHLIVSYTTTDALMVVSLLDVPSIVSLHLTGYSRSLGDFIDHCEPLLRAASVVNIAFRRSDTDATERLLRALRCVRRLELGRSDGTVITTFMRLLDDYTFALPRLAIVLFVSVTDVKTATGILTKLAPPRFQLGCKLVAGFLTTPDWDSHIVVEWTRRSGGDASWSAFQDRDTPSVLLPMSYY